MDQTTDATTSTSTSSAADARTREAEELAALFAEPGDSDGKPPAAEQPDDQEQTSERQPDSDGKKSRKTLDLPDGKKAELPDESALPAKQFKALRRLRDQVENNAAQLRQREAVIAQNQRALEQRARELETTTAAAKKTAEALERLKSGDPDAAQELGLDLEALNLAHLKHQTGDARIERLERQLQERKDREKKEEQERAKREEEQQGRAAAEASEKEILTEVEEAAKTTKLLARIKDPKGRLASVEAVAAEWNAAGRGGTYTVAEAVVEAEKRLVALASDWAPALGYQPPPGTRPEQTLSRRDGERGAPRQGPKNRDEELDEVASIINNSLR